MAEPERYPTGVVAVGVPEEPDEVLGLLKALVAVEPTYDDDFMNTWCIYCHGDEGPPGEGFTHADDCPWVRAHDLLLAAGGTQ
jgi:hypothetical protein